MADEKKPRLDLVEVIKIARTFAEIAGWGYFRVHSIAWKKDRKQWLLSAYLGALNDRIMYFYVDNDKEKIVQYTAEKPDAEKDE